MHRRGELPEPSHHLGKALHLRMLLGLGVVFATFATARAVLRLSYEGSGAVTRFHKAIKVLQGLYYKASSVGVL